MPSGKNDKESLMEYEKKMQTNPKDSEKNVKEGRVPDQKNRMKDKESGHR
ncbi:hypothetical protein [Jeotgalibacillus proteolyticus]|nr:hypothetical protein [Jeotgalibacillus proteolyticus]